jgi:N-carbamoylputrescine amidase
LVPGSGEWQSLRNGIIAQAPDILVMNEMPFGNWFAGAPDFDPQIAAQAVASHVLGLEELKRLPVPFVISSQPVHAKGRLANEAFLLEGGEYSFLHQKHYFPEEPGFFERSWFDVERTGFEVARVGTLRTGALLCTELMFNERARAYGRAGADLIVVPRAAGTSHGRWFVSGAMAALVAGSYVVSSNRAGSCAGGPTFGGNGFAYAPDGELIGKTSGEEPIFTFDLDVDTARTQKSKYPCYVQEFF